MSPDNIEVARRFSTLTTPLVADGCVRQGVPVRCAPPGVVPVIPGRPIAGRALTVHHHGSVDVFLAALENAGAGDVLVIDNEGRRDEACLGDLIALEARSSGIAGIVTWGLVRDTAELIAIGLPVYALGSYPAGPACVRPNATDEVLLGDVRVVSGELVFADDDGVLVVAGSDVVRVLDAATEIAQRERAQAERARAGQSLREQFRFAEYLARRALEPTYTLREHLARLGAAVEV